MGDQLTILVSTNGATTSKVDSKSVSISVNIPVEKTKPQDFSNLRNEFSPLHLKDQSKVDAPSTRSETLVTDDKSKTVTTTSKTNDTVTLVVDGKNTTPEKTESPQSDKPTIILETKPSLTPVLTKEDIQKEQEKQLKEAQERAEIQKQQEEKDRRIAAVESKINNIELQIKAIESLSTKLVDLTKALAITPGIKSATLLKDIKIIEDKKMELLRRKEELEKMILLEKSKDDTGEGRIEKRCGDWETRLSKTNAAIEKVGNAAAKAKAYATLLQENERTPQTTAKVSIPINDKNTGNSQPIKVESHVSTIPGTAGYSVSSLETWTREKLQADLKSALDRVNEALKELSKIGDASRAKKEIEQKAEYTQYLSLRHAAGELKAKFGPEAASYIDNRMALIGGPFGSGLPSDSEISNFLNERRKNS